MQTHTERLAKYTMNSIRKFVERLCVCGNETPATIICQRANVRDKEGQRRKSACDSHTVRKYHSSLSQCGWVRCVWAVRWMDKNKFMELILMVLSCCVYFFAIISCRLTVAASGSLYSSLIQRSFVRSFCLYVHFVRYYLMCAVVSLDIFFSFTLVQCKYIKLYIWKQRNKNDIVTQVYFGMRFNEIKTE